jgi:multicomponent Na+:H+ antiporter subunit C
MNFLTVEILAIAVFIISFYGLMVNKNIIKSIISIVLMEMATIMFLIGVGFSDGMKPPIGEIIENPADPLPQALVITTIVIGLAITAVNIIFFNSICRQYGAADWDTVKKKNLE